ncbi:ABC transporter permease [Thalassotalea fonticola]|uniref:ABC transporter permease n=1 Tax=Thalassotalea fonticola TaxID=3065649 RepID=A0ABZ0GP83_9GAMM|nr:ABC transporter permease [Colwelliaceae bacterium S1-1]
MFSYYLRLAWISIIKHWGLSLVMITAIGLGIGASMTTVTVNYLMSANPIPHKSSVLYNVQLDSWDINEPANDDGSPPEQLTYRDATYLMSAKKAFRQNIQAQAHSVIEPEGDGALPFMVSARANSASFFSMFDLPFIYGSGWDQSADDNKEQVVVLSSEINQRVFGGEDSVGKSIKIGGNYFKVVGVIDYWNPTPKFYDISTGAFDDSEEIFVPFSLIAEEKINRSGNTSCWKPPGDGFQAFLNSECVWLQFWVELPNEQAKEEYLSFLNAYVEEQKALGRFERPLNNRLNNVMQWLEQQQIVSDDAVMMMTMSFMFLVVCLLNTVGLLLAKFIGKAPEIGLRQALGASRRTLFSQYIIESGCIGVAGGLLGLLFAWLGLQGIESLYGDMLKGLTGLDTTMIVSAIVLAVITSIIAGLYPTWRACNVQPSQQLKSQ